MEFNRFTEKLQEGFRSAQALATKRGHQQVDVEHLLVALLSQDGGLMQSLLTKAEVDLTVLHQRLMDQLEKLPRVQGSAPGIDQVYVTQRLQDLLQRAEKQAKQLNDEYISVEHVLLAAATEKVFQ